MWAQFILKMPSFPADQLPAGTMGPMREHAAQFTHAEQLAELVHECSIAKTQAGDALVVRSPRAWSYLQLLLGIVLHNIFHIIFNVHYTYRA